MKILFLALSFPKLDKATYMYSGLVKEIHKNGHDLLVVAPAYDREIVGIQYEVGVKVIRVPTMQLFRVGLLQKGLANILLPLQYKKWIKKCQAGTDFDLIIVPTPPITLYKLVAWFKKKGKPIVYLILRDIFPQNAVDLGIMKAGGIIHRYFRSQERKLYRLADKIGCMSQGNISFIKKHNPEVPPEKLHILANWADMIPLDYSLSEEELRKKEGVSGKFFVVFGGNIGLPQKMENVVALAKACESHKDILFRIYGYGSEIEQLHQLIESSNSTNIQLFSGIPQKEFINILRIADVGLISLSEHFTIPNIPSKALSYYNAKVPILASIDLNTDFGQILEKYHTGLWAEAGNTAKLKEKLLELYNDEELRKEMGDNGFKYMQEELSCHGAYTILLSAVNGLSGRNRN